MIELAIQIGILLVVMWVLGKTVSKHILNIIQEEPLVERVVELGDPEFVTARQLASKGIQAGFDKYFNTKGLDPLVIQKGTPIKVKWFEDSTLEVTPIRFRVQLSDTNPVGLLMDIIPILGRSQTGQTDLFKAQQVKKEVEPKFDQLTKELYRDPEQGTLPEMEIKQESDYSFLRTPPLWEQKLPLHPLCLNDLPLIKRNNLGPNSPHDINTKQFVEHPLIIISKNMSGENMPDLNRKAYILDLIGKFTGANTRLINMTGNDSQYLKALADKHGMIYTQHK